MENPLAGIEQIAEIADPAQRAREIGQRLRDIPAYQKQLREMRQAAVLELRERNMTFAEISKAIGLHRNRVQQIAEGRSAGGQGGATKPEAD